MSVETRIGENYQNHTYSPFQEILYGPKPFYQDEEKYVASTKDDFSQKNALPYVTYRWNTEHKIIRIVKEIFSLLLFPIAAYNILHALIGRVIVISSNISNKVLTDTRLSIPLNDYSYSHSQKNDGWKYKRITIEVDGRKIDTIIMGRPSTFHNKRWTLYSHPNGGNNEGHLIFSYDFKELLSSLDSNIILFNNPGVGASSGFPNRKAMEKAYRAILTFLEDEKKGIGAKEIIGYGFSLGGGVQGDALKHHKLKKNIHYVFLKDRTFKDLNSEVPFLLGKIGIPYPLARISGFLVKIFGWNVSSVESSKKLQAPEIILQTRKKNDVDEGHPYKILNDSTQIADDGIIGARVSLAKALLDDKNCPKQNKLFLGLCEEHNDPLSYPKFIAQKIADFLPKNK